MRFPLRRRFVLAVCALALAAPGLSSASTEFTPVIGLIDPANSEYINVTNSPLVIALEPSTAYGARLGWWANSRLAIEGSLVASGATLRLTGNAALETSGTLLQCDARARLRLNSPAATNHFDLIVGGGVTGAQFDLTKFFEESGLRRKNQPEWVAGLGTTLGLWPNAALRIEIEDHMHSALFKIDPAVNSFPASDRTAHELLWTTGIVVPLGRR